MMTIWVSYWIIIILTDEANSSHSEHLRLGRSVGRGSGGLRSAAASAELVACTVPCAAGASPIITISDGRRVRVRSTAARTELGACRVRGAAWANPTTIRGRLRT